MTNNKPTLENIEWALNTIVDIYGANNKVEPSSTKKSQGWEPEEYPPYNWENWMKYEFYKWHTFINNFFEFFSGQTTNATETEIFLNGVADSRLVINTNSIITFEAIVSAILSDAGQSKSWKITSSIIRNTETIIMDITKIIIGQYNWDITTIGATSGNSGILGEDGTPRSIFFKPDGTELYMIGAANRTVYQYPLSTPWDITTIGATSGNSGILGEDGTPTSIFFKPDGTELYMIGTSNKTVYQYPLSTPWDITTIGATSGNSGALGEDSTPISIFFKPDGTELYMIGQANQIVYQYPLSTPWLISSKGATSGNSGVLGEDNIPISISFKPDGTELYMMGTTNDTVYQYPLSTPWLISSKGATSGNSGVLGEDGAPASIFFKPDGTELYMMGTTNDTVYQYPLNTSWDVNFEADIINNALVPKVTGETGKTINWNIKLEKLVNEL